MRSPASSGLTLVEVLVVLAVIGIVGSVAVLSVGPTARSSTLQAEAQRLAASIQRASDEALIADRAAALSWDESRYAFVEWDGEARRWQPRQEASAHELPDDMILAAQGGEAPAAIGEAAGPLQFTLTEGARSWRVSYDGLNAVAAPADAR